MDMINYYHLCFRKGEQRSLSSNADIASLIKLVLLSVTVKVEAAASTVESTEVETEEAKAESEER